MKKIEVKSLNSYDVIIKSGILKKIFDYLPDEVRSGKCVVITDDNVDALYGDTLRKNLDDEEYENYTYVINHGEESKNSSVYIEILNFLAECRITRSDFVIALGGGVVGDLAGFAAATYLRGINFIQIPTTLLADVDSSVGGKTGIDLPSGKNLAGAFHQPKQVLCDPSVLDTLPADILLDGCSEVIKYGILGNYELFRHMMEFGAAFDREYVISECVRMKSDIVACDEYDNGCRQLLNLGHTVGHAIEKLSRYRVSHGEAVASGIALIARSSAAKGICTSETSDKIQRIVEMFGHPVESEFSTVDLCDAMLSDKKRNGESINIVVICEIGRCRLVKMNMEELFDFISLGRCEVRGDICD